MPHAPHTSLFFPCFSKFLDNKGGNDKTVRLWDAHRLQLLNTFSDATSSVARLAFSLGGDVLLAGCNDGVVHVYNCGSLRRRMHTLTGHTEKVWGVGSLMDGKTVATGSHDRTLRWWDIGARARVRICATLGRVE